MRAVATATLAVAVMACGTGNEGVERAEPRHDPRHVVRITDGGYEPARLLIEAGDRVTFSNESTTQSHSAQDESRGDVDPSPETDGATDHSGADVNYAYKRGFATHALFPGESQAVVFRVGRRYVYHCTFHPEMTGVIEVTRKGRDAAPAGRKQSG